MARQRRQLEQIREELPTNSAMLLNTNQGLSAPRRGLSSTPCKASCTLLGEGGDGTCWGPVALVFHFSGGLGCSWGLITHSDVSWPPHIL